MVDLLTRSRTMFFERFLESLDQSAQLSLFDVVAKAQYDDGLDHLVEVWDEVEQRVWKDRNAVTATDEALVSDVSDIALPIWPEEFAAVHVHLPNGAIASDFLHIANLILDLLNSHIAWAHPEVSGTLVFDDVVVGTGSFRLRLQGVVDNATGGTVSTVIGGMIMLGLTTAIASAPGPDLGKACDAAIKARTGCEVVVYAKGGYAVRIGSEIFEKASGKEKAKTFTLIGRFPNGKTGREAFVTEGYDARLNVTDMRVPAKPLQMNPLLTGRVYQITGRYYETPVDFGFVMTKADLIPIGVITPARKQR